jgi:5,5'-dehydrodivanillate O-demethylase
LITEEENDVLTRVGPGTPAGELQRRYWHVIAGVAELEDCTTKRVRLLGEDLVLGRDAGGSFGLTGHSYPIEVLGGLIWAYLGPQPAPLLPRWDGFVGDTVIRLCGWNIVNCNWLQIMENSVDPVHTEWLHGAMLQFIKEKEGKKYAIAAKHLKIDFAEFEFGVYKRRLLEGASEDSDDWRVGHPVLFPNTLALGSGGGNLWKNHKYQIRVPMDDEHTMTYWYAAYEPPAGAHVPEHLLDRVHFYETPTRDASGEYLLDVVNVQDVMAWETQGPIAKRHLERLGTTDKGVIFYRNMLKRELNKVAAGEDPMGTLRDPARNEVLTFPLERDKAHYTDGFERMIMHSPARYSPIAKELCDVFAAYTAEHSRKLFPLPQEAIVAR